MFGCFCDDVCFGDVFLGLVFLLPEGLPCLQLIWRFPASYTRNYWHCSIPFGSQVTGGGKEQHHPRSQQWLIITLPISTQNKCSKHKDHHSLSSDFKSSTTDYIWANFSYNCWIWMIRAFLGTGFRAFSPHFEGWPPNQRDLPSDCGTLEWRKAKFFFHDLWGCGKQNSSGKNLRSLRKELVKTWEKIHHFFR